MTAEGEHAVLVTLGADSRRGRVSRLVGIVFADDYQAIIDAAFDASHDELFMPFVETLVRAYPLLAGHRPRKIELTAPSGWAARCRGLLTHFYAPSFERDGSLLTIPPAEPHGVDSIIKKLVHEDMLWSFVLKQQPTTRPVENFFGIRGCLTAVSGELGDRRMQVQAVVLDDARFHYVVRLESSAHIDPEEVLLPVARSIRPVPEPDRNRTSPAEPLSPLWYYSD